MGSFRKFKFDVQGSCINNNQSCIIRTKAESKSVGLVKPGRKMHRRFYYIYLTDNIALYHSFASKT